MNHDQQILRKLAGQYRLYTESEHNLEAAKLHKASNDLHMIRPVVIIEELPWCELQLENELTLQCQDPYLRKIENFFRMEIYRFEHLRADMVLRPFVPIEKVVHTTGYGMEIQEDLVFTDVRNGITSHGYHDQLSCRADLEKLHKEVITYDEAETNRRFNLVGDMIGDIVPVRKTGFDYVGSAPWDRIAMLRGVTNLLIDLAEEPEFSHEVVSRLVEIEMDTMDQYMALGLFDTRPWSLHATPIFTDDLYGNGFDGEHMTFDNVWGRGAAQIFVSVSKAMREEFDIAYQKKALGRCGLVYYGCCEPLDKQIDIVEQIPNLRKISITPWADVDVAAEAIGKKYVLSSKPNPANVAVSSLDHDEVRKELTRIVDACRRNGCNTDIVLKDVSTCCSRPQNLFEWEKIAMDIVNNY